VHAAWVEASQTVPSPTYPASRLLPCGCPSPVASPIFYDSATKDIASLWSSSHSNPVASHLATNAINAALASEEFEQKSRATTTSTTTSSIFGAISGRRGRHSRTTSSSTATAAAAEAMRAKCSIS